MQSPSKPKWRKQMKQVRHLKGVETRGTELAFGDYGIRAIESGWLTNRQIEAARIAISRKAKRGGKIWINIFADKPLTSKPAETRMGKGKGSPEHWVAEVRAGKIMYELTGVTEALAFEALKLAVGKLPLRCKVIKRSANLL